MDAGSALRSVTMRRVALVAVVAFAVILGLWLSATWVHDTFHLSWLWSSAIAPPVLVIGGILFLWDDKRRGRYAGRSKD